MENWFWPSAEEEHVDECEKHAEGRREKKKIDR